jgi:small conductance mechanosensitive channel
MFGLIHTIQEAAEAAPAPEESGSYADKAMEAAQAFAPKVVAAVIILVAGWILAGILTSIFRGAMRRATPEETLVKFLSTLVKTALLAFVVVAAISKLGVQTTSFVAIIGAAGLAVGFALQGSLAHFAAGVMILIFKPFKVGDVIEAGGAVGKVIEVGMFATIMHTPDNRKVIVGNSAVTGGNIMNINANDTRRVDMVFGIGYDDDVKAARELLMKIVTEHPKVLATPEPTVKLSELANSSVNFICRPWVETSDYWDVHFDVHEAVKEKFDAAGISIPYPQQDVHVHQVA